MDDHEKRCDQCGEPVPADAPGGACPRCLLEAGLSTDEGPFTDEELAAAFPRLEILSLIGQGGMGVVYRARQKTLDRIVALKILTPDIARDAAFADRFGQEARALAQLSHPNIVAVHEADESAGLYYLTMEFVDGVNLRELLRSGGLPPEKALAIVPQICDALQYAHDAGVVHRDVKPENILIDRQGNVKIADFGLARILGTDARDTRLTGTEQVMGTLHYIAPEQIKEPRDVDHRADIYSLGVVFYEMLTGEVPIGRFQPPSEKVRVDVRLDEVVLRALERERDRRYQRVDEVKTGVEGVTATPPPPRPAPPTAPPVDKPRLSRMAVLGILGVPVTILAVIVLAALRMPVMFVAITLFGGAVVGTGMILSVIAWVRISGSPDRLRGKGLAITGTFLPVGLLVLSIPLGMLVYLTSSKQESEDWIQVEELIMKAEELSGMGMTPLEDVAELMDPAKRDWFLALPQEEFKRRYDEGSLGLAMFDHEFLPTPLARFRFSRLETWEGQLVAVTRWEGYTLRFPVVRVDGELFLGVGPMNLSSGG